MSNTQENNDENESILNVDTKNPDTSDDLVVNSLRTTRCNSFKMISSFVMFGLLCVSWGGVIFTHFQFKEYGNYEDVWDYFLPVFVFTYINIIVFLSIWTSVMFKCCWYNSFVKIKNVVLISSSVICFLFTIPVLYVQHDYKDYHEYQRGVFLASLFQLFICVYFSILLYKHNGEIPCRNV